MTRIAIIGGGIAGLAAAYELELARAAGADVEHELFEAGPRLGGVISSTIIDETVIERGPDSFLSEKPAAATLCRELGLERALIPSNDEQRKTFIVVRNRLVPLPDGLMFLVPTKILPMVFSPLFGWGTKLRMGLELLDSPRADSIDESVAQLVRRHYGQQVVDRLADPLLSGIYGGDAERLSALSVLPRLVELERKYGSLTKGTLAGMAARRAAAEAAERAADDAGEAPKPPEAPRAIFTTLRGGLQQMVDALIRRLDPSRVRLNCPVKLLERVGSDWRVVFEDSSSAIFNGVIVATPAWAAGTVLRSVDAGLSAELEAIEYSSSVTINLVFDGIDLDPLPEGFGFLVPPAEGRAMLACTFLHRKFLGRTAPGKSVLRAFVGGARNSALLAETDEALVERVRRELFEILRISALPELTDVQRWPRAMAQYSVGHTARLARIRERLGSLPGLRLVGNAYDGIGISDCIRLGRAAATELAGNSVLVSPTLQ